MNKREAVRAFFKDVEVLMTVENTYRPELNGTRRRITRLGKTYFEATLLDATTDGRQMAGSECRGGIPIFASEVLSVSETEATFRLGPPGTRLYEHRITYRKQSVQST
jgi:hypothetical protein